jgi:hypothetical protein
MLDAQLETRTVCFTVTGTPIPASGASGTVEADVEYDLGTALPVLGQPGASYSLTLQELDLSLGQGSAVADLGGVEELDISVLAPAGTSLPEPVLIRYLKGADPHPRRIVAAAETAVDLRPYIESGRVTFQALARGTLPAHPWTADTRACFLLDMSVQYAQYATSP